jgi:hypothetical protein
MVVLLSLPFVLQQKRKEKKACCNKENGSKAAVAFFVATRPKHKQREEKGLREGAYLQAPALGLAWVPFQAL